MSSTTTKTASRILKLPKFRGSVFKGSNLATSDAMKHKLRYVLAAQRNRKIFDRKLLFRQIFLSVTTFVSIGLMIAANEIEFNGTTENANYISEILRSIICGLTLLMEFQVANYCQIKANLIAVQYKVVGGLWFWQDRGTLFDFFMYFLIVLPHPFPWLSYATTPDFWLLKLLSMLMFLRLVFPLLILFHISRFWRSRYAIERFARNRVEFDWAFAGKAIFSMHPILMLIVLTTPLFFVLAYCIYLAERTVTPLRFGLYTNCMWYTIVTMSTVGYGDFFPTSDFGRFVGCFIILSGLILFAVITASMANQLLLSQAEQQIADFYVYRNCMLTTRETSANLIQTAYRRHRWRKEEKPLINNENEKFSHESKFNRKISGLIIEHERNRRELYTAEQKLGRDNIPKDFQLE